MTQTTPPPDDDEAAKRLPQGHALMPQSGEGRAIKPAGDFSGAALPVPGNKGRYGPRLSEDQANARYSIRHCDDMFDYMVNANRRSSERKGMRTALFQQNVAEQFFSKNIWARVANGKDSLADITQWPTALNALNGKVDPARFLSDGDCCNEEIRKQDVRTALGEALNQKKAEMGRVLSGAGSLKPQPG